MKRPQSTTRSRTSASCGSRSGARDRVSAAETTVISRLKLADLLSCDMLAFRDSVTKLEKKAPQRASLNLSSILRPIMIRRTKKSKFHGKDILVLPKRHLDDVKVDLSLDERQIYDACVQPLLCSARVI